MKKLLLVSAIAALGLSSVAFAGGIPEEMPAAPAAVTTSSDAGMYVGIEGGYAMTNWKNIENSSFANTVSKDNGMVGRGFFGYDFNKYFATEFGYSYFFNKALLKNASVDMWEVKTQAFDLVGKIKAPVMDNFDLYAKLGGGYLMSNFKGKTKGFAESHNDAFNVVYGAGADYSVTPNVIVNAEWLRINGHEKGDSKDAGTLDNIKFISKYQPHTDSFMVGVRYKFNF